MPFRRNVFILGAGFSADAGAPVMKNFLQRANHLRQDPHSGLLQLDQEAFSRVFEFLRTLRAAQARITLDLENIEHLFGLAEMDIEFGLGNRGSFGRDLIFLILRTLERSIRTDLLARGRWPIVTREDGGRHARGVEATYGEFFAALASRRWLGGAYAVPPDGHCQDTIITMNYDCFLDDALVRLGVAPNYELLAATYPDNLTTLSFRIDFLKLHGSANWLRCTSESCSGRIWIWEGGPAARLEYFYGGSCPACGHPLEPVIVPPTWDKGGRREIFAPVWRRALQALQEAGRIFVIGYSMPGTDAFFQYMLGLALATNEGIEQVIVVNPDVHVLDKYARLFQEHFRSRKFVREQTYSIDFITRSLARALGQEQEGVSREMIEASGIPVD